MADKASSTSGACRRRARRSRGVRRLLEDARRGSRHARRHEAVRGFVPPGLGHPDDAEYDRLYGSAPRPRSRPAAPVRRREATGHSIESGTVVVARGPADVCQQCGETTNEDTMRHRRIAKARLAGVVSSRSTRPRKVSDGLSGRSEHLDLRRMSRRRREPASQVTRGRPDLSQCHVGGIVGRHVVAQLPYAGKQHVVGVAVDREINQVRRASRPRSLSRSNSSPGRAERRLPPAAGSPWAGGRSSRAETADRASRSARR